MDRVCVNVYVCMRVFVSVCVVVMLRGVSPVAALLHHVPESAVGKETRGRGREKGMRDKSRSTVSGKSSTKWGRKGRRMRGKIKAEDLGKEWHRAFGKDGMGVYVLEEAGGGELTEGRQRARDSVTHASH